jgi:hypothetical protein
MRWLLLALLLLPAHAEAAERRVYPWRFAYVTDKHAQWPAGGTVTRNMAMFGAMVDSIESLGVDLLIDGGDWGEQSLVDNSNGATDSLTAILARFSGTYLPIMGNWEAIAADTVLQRNPYQSAQDRFPAVFGGRNYWKRDHKNVRVIALQNVANVDVGASTDYRINNPTTYAAPTGGITGIDWDGITVTTSPQRVALAGWTEPADVGSRWVIVVSHRMIYGTEVGNPTRHNLGRAARGTGYVKAVEDSLPTGRRALFLCGDQHVNHILTRAIRDSALAGATEKGGYHFIVSSGGGARSGDTTDVPANFYESYWFRESGDALTNGLSTDWADTLTLNGDPGLPYVWTWALFTVHGDDIQVETFRTFTSDSEDNAQYTGHLSHRLMNRRTIRRDVD